MPSGAGKPALEPAQRGLRDAADGHVRQLAREVPRAIQDQPFVHVPDVGGLRHGEQFSDEFWLLFRPGRQTEIRRRERGFEDACLRCPRASRRRACGLRSSATRAARGHPPLCSEDYAPRSVGCFPQAEPIDETAKVRQPVIRELGHVATQDEMMHHFQKVMEAPEATAASS